MSAFTSNTIRLAEQTVAEKLRTARQAKKLKLEDIAKKININYKHLRALEKGEYLSLPAGVYGKSFLRTYAEYLGLDCEEILNYFDKETSLIKPAQKSELFAKQRIQNRNLIITSKIVKNIFVFITITVCFVYLGWRITKIVSPPDLQVVNPTENLITSTSTLEIIGQSEAEAKITVNGDLVLSNTLGQFTKIISLKIGVNTITITAKKKYGQEKQIIRQVMLKQDIKY